MKKNIIEFGAILAVSMMTISAPVMTMAYDIIIAKNTNIDVQQNNTKKDTIEEIKKTEETEKNTNLKNPDINNYITENSSETIEQVSETTTNETESAEDNTINEPNLTDDKETTEGELISEEKSTEETTRKETENADNTSSDTNVNIDNTNYVEINNNTGNVYVNIYNGIGVDINNNGNKEADVNVLVDNEIGIIGNETSSETQETETAEETKTIEETTEETTEKTTETPKRSSHSSSRRRSYSSKKKSAVLNTSNKTVDKVKEVNADEVEDEKEKKVVCMTIGSNLMNINGEAVETDTSPYISNSYTLVPLRCISTVFDAEVEWDKNTKTAIIKADGIETRFTINSYTMLVNGRTVMIPKAAEIKNGRTYVPLRALGESLNANVSWIPDSKSVLIIK